MVKRTFIGMKIEASPALVNSMIDVRQRLAREKINWVDPSLFHITLHFLGATSDALIESIDDNLKNVLGRYSRQPLLIKGLGVFPNLKKAKVLWAGLEYHQSLEDLQQEVVDVMIKHGLEIDTRHFKPHLTIGRIKYINHPEALENVLDKFETKVFDKVKLKSVTFFESRLSASGPAYFPLHVYELK